MDLSDTHKEAAKEAVNKVGAEFENEEILRLQEEIENLRKEIDLKDSSTFTIEATSDTYLKIQKAEDLVDKAITRILEKAEIKTDDINVAMGVLAIMEKYRTMKTNCYSIIKFKYPTGERI